ncbi:type II toxin-antitoxin system PemI/MazE family antitoxin [uncultured Streptococcus sp.]|jgi:hypothetical protein|uniref:type II toxin-antitoxin system PemI/MazE family antitoxin n=1 Tax=uncultured Streptococcus sp. TaxID=83427 RepID=UPI0028D83419|nr:AbrB family transcriptional regulator [uncultured Streptococcus sp.]
MNTVKTRKVGNSITVTIPKTLNVPEGQEMFIYKGVDNVIVLAPKIPDPFSGDTDLRMENDF